MNLLEGEKKIASLGNDVFLTNYRVIKEKKYNTENSYIFLDKLNGVKVYYKENFNLIIYGLAFIVLGVIVGNYLAVLGYLPILLGIILVGRYYRTREHVLSFISGGICLDIEVNRASYNHVQKFNLKVQNEALNLKNNS